MKNEIKTLASIEATDSPSGNGVKRRSFLKGMGVAGAAIAGGSLLTAAAQTKQAGVITSGDVAIALPGRGRTD